MKLVLKNMLNKDEENNEKLKEYKKLLEGLESLFNEFQMILELMIFLKRK